MKKSIRTKYQIYIIERQKRKNVYEQYGTSPLDALQKFLEPRRNPNYQFVYKKIKRNYFKLISYYSAHPFNVSYWRVYEKEYSNET